MAHAEVLGKMQPRLAMQINSGTSNGHNALVCNAATPSNVTAAEVKVDLAAKQVSVQSQLSAEVIAGLIREEGYTVS